MNLMVTRIQWFISMLYISITDYVRLIRNDTTIGRIELSGSKNKLSLILKVLTAQLLGILLIVFLTSANKDNAEMIVYDKSQNGQSTEGSPKEQQETQVQLNTSFINYARSRYVSYIEASSDTKSVCKSVSSVRWRRWWPFTRSTYLIQADPTNIIKSNLEPGFCWCFVGSHGSVDISWVHNITITGWTYKHCRRYETKTPDSAPRQMSLFNQRLNQSIGDFEFLYEDYKQSFSLKNTVYTDQMQIKVLSNWGNQYFTCLYKVKFVGPNM
ncbi:hypothetical protein ACOME3_001488 [Neoechinorhynchus agilis]